MKWIGVKIITASLFMFSFLSMQINMTSLEALTLTNRLNRAIRNALTCSNVPRDQQCSQLTVDGYVIL